MPVTKTWKRFGRGIEAEPDTTLGVFLGDQDAVADAKSRKLRAPTKADFARDKAFDPNPNNLDLDADYLETAAMVGALAVWGKTPLLRAAVACSELQHARQPKCLASLQEQRDRTCEAIRAFMTSESSERLRVVSDLARGCAEQFYGVHEDDPCSQQAMKTWAHLGAVWCAAEAISQDWALQPYDGPAPASSQSTWCKRNAVWPERAAEAAAQWSSHTDTREAITSSLLGWIRERSG